MPSETRERGRDGQGRFLRTVEEMERDHEAARLRGQSLTYAVIAQRMGWANAGVAYRAVQRAFADVPTEDTETARKRALESLDFMERRARSVLARPNYKVSAGGKVVLFDGKPVIDYEMELKVLDRLLRIEERRARMLGLDSPLAVEMTSVVYDGTTIEGQVELLRRLFAKAGGSEIVLDGREGEAGADPPGELGVANLPLPRGQADGQDPDGG